MIISNGFRWEIATGIIRSGLVLCPCTTLSVSKDIAFRIEASQTSIFIGDTSSIKSFLEITQNLPKMKIILQADGLPINGILQYEERMKILPEDTTFVGPITTVSDPALIYFTSGTTGLPKMVLHNQVTYPLGKYSILFVTATDFCLYHKLTNNQSTCYNW